MGKYLDIDMEEMWKNIEAAVWVRELHEKWDKEEREQEVDFSANDDIMSKTDEINTPKKEG